MPNPYEETISVLLGTFKDKLKVSLVGHLATVYLSGSSQVTEWGKTKFTDKPILYEGPPIQKALDYAQRHGAKLVTEMNKETQERLANVIKNAIEEKRGIPGLARDIKKEFDDMTKYRSEMVARTETADALQQGFMDRAKGLGITGKEWVVSDPCETCEENGSLGPVPVNEAAYKDKEGNSIQRPPAHPNCRCALAPVMLKED